jgi:hypothetical protein
MHNETHRTLLRYKLSEFFRSLLGHFSSPLGSAWIDAGILRRRSRSTFGQVDFASHFRDLLIASEALQTGATLVTENSRDFARWKSLFASGRKTLKLFNPS